jgi:hypothetical protein
VEEIVFTTVVTVTLILVVVIEKDQSILGGIRPLALLWPRCAVAEEEVEVGRKIEAEYGAESRDKDQEEVGDE